MEGARILAYVTAAADQQLLLRNDIWLPKSGS
jgi:hypothetical protein